MSGCGLWQHSAVPVCIVSAWTFRDSQMLLFMYARKCESEFTQVHSPIANGKWENKWKKVVTFELLWIIRVSRSQKHPRKCYKFIQGQIHLKLSVEFLIRESLILIHSLKISTTKSHFIYIENLSEKKKTIRNRWNSVVNNFIIFLWCW